MTAPIGKQRVVTPQPQTLVSSPWTALGRGPCLDTHWREKGKCTEVGETLFPGAEHEARVTQSRAGWFLKADSGAVVQRRNSGWKNKIRTQSICFPLHHSPEEETNQKVCTPHARSPASSRAGLWAQTSPCTGLLPGAVGQRFPVLSGRSTSFLPVSSSRWFGHTLAPSSHRTSSPCLVLQHLASFSKGMHN